MFRDATLLQENISWLLLVNPFADSFVNSDYFEWVIYFHINEQDDELNVFTVHFSIKEPTWLLEPLKVSKQKSHILQKFEKTFRWKFCENFWLPDN